MFPSKRFKVLAAIPKKDGSSFWMNCGVMFEAKTPNTYNLYLDAVPTHQKEGRVMFHLREWTEDDLRESRERAERRNTNGGSSSYSSSSYSARGTVARTDANGSPMLGPDLPLFEPPSRSHDANEQPPF
jgi:hypothetical protein